jgi:hypothetical protein
MLTVLLVIAVLMLLGILPAWPHSRSWGYVPRGGLALVVLVLLLSEHSPQPWAAAMGHGRRRKEYRP